MWPITLFVRFINRAYSDGNLYRHWPAMGGYQGQNSAFLFCCAIFLFCYDVLSFSLNILSFCYAIPSFSYSGHSLLFLPNVQLCGSVVLLGYFVSIV